MDAQHYCHLTDAIAAAKTAETLTSLSEVVSCTEMHPLERRVLERALRSRADALRIGDIVVPRPAAQRAD